MIAHVSDRVLGFRGEVDSIAFPLPGVDSSKNIQKRGHHRSCDLECLFLQLFFVQASAANDPLVGFDIANHFAVSSRREKFPAQARQLTQGGKRKGSSTPTFLR